MSTPLYSVIIPAFNEERLLPQSLLRLRECMQQIPEPGEVIVVDNNSSDRTAEVARSHGASVVFEAVNQISRARNAGARAAAGRFLVFLDADTFLNPDLLRQALYQLKSGRVCGGGATIVFDRPTSALHRFLLGFWTAFSRRFALAAGCFVFCRADAFREVGGFSEKVYASEEIWLSHRMHRWGRRHRQRFVIIPKPPITTSARKTENPVRIILQVLIILAFPLAPRFRFLSWFWYKRPL